MKYEVGQRITAVLSANPTAITLLGHGVFKGDLPHPDIGIPNPCLLLDDGTTQWGCDCWWGPEGKVMAKFQRDYPLAAIVQADTSLTNQPIQGA